MLQNTVTAANIFREYTQDIDKRQEELFCKNRVDVSAGPFAVKRERLRPVAVKVCVLYGWSAVRIDVHEKDGVRQVRGQGIGVDLAQRGAAITLSGVVGWEELFQRQLLLRVACTRDEKRLLLTRIRQRLDQPIHPVRIHQTWIDWRGQLHESFVVAALHSVRRAVRRQWSPVLAPTAFGDVGICA